MIPDRSYPRVFHSPGVEPWILGLLLDVKPRSLLDIGCGHGFWGFVVRRRIGVSYAVGLDIDSAKAREARAVYDDVVVGDASAPPFRDRSFDSVLAVEVLHGLRDPRDAVKRLRGISRSLLVATFSGAQRWLCRALEAEGFSVYRYLLRGFMVVGKGRVYTMYDKPLWRLAAAILRIVSRFFRYKGYIIIT